jgi:hypothetical protein
MIAKPKEFYRGIFMLAAFSIVFASFMSPVFNGKNGLDFLDNFYNSISKSSSYYVPKLKKSAEKFSGNMIKVSLELGKQDAETALQMFNAIGVKPIKTADQISIEADMKLILDALLIDADLMVANDGAKLKEKYGIDEKRAMFTWWKVAGEIDKKLKKQDKFKEAIMFDSVKKKGIEQAYNYYGVKMEKAQDKIILMSLSLIFYVIYTIWYGYSILFIFEGIGLKIGH